MINFGAVAVACDVLGDGDGGGDDHNEWRARLWELGQRRGNVCRGVLIEEHNARVWICIQEYRKIIYMYKWIAPVVRCRIGQVYNLLEWKTPHHSVIC